MDVIKKWIRNFFGFSAREINGFLVLFPLLIFMIASEPLYRWWVANRDPDVMADNRKLDSLMATWKKDSLTVDQDPPIVKKNPIKGKLFAFNPNKASLDELQSLGFPKNLAIRIASYRQKGGEFRIRDDLKKIYGVDTALYNRVHDYINLPETFEKKFTTRDSTRIHRNDLLQPFDLNTADTAQLKSVYGIGATLARRILKFRDGLGGFVSNGQLNEVFGLDSAAVQRLSSRSFIAKDFVPRKIDINVADEKELTSHPYIKKYIANAIVAYRFQHGDFKSVEELNKLEKIKKTDRDKIIPYLVVNH